MTSNTSNLHQKINYISDSDNETDSEQDCCNISNGQNGNISNILKKRKQTDEISYMTQIKNLIEFQNQNNIANFDFNSFNFLQPSTFIRELNRKLLIEIELPGVDRKDIKISFNHFTLTIIGIKKQQYDAYLTMQNFKRHDKSNGIFKRVLIFKNNSIYKSSVQARNVDGILLITFEMNPNFIDTTPELNFKKIQNY